METLSVMLVDDHVMMRAGVKVLLDRVPSCSVVAEASNCSEALLRASETRPRVALVDISIGHESGLDLLRALKQRLPTIAVAILSMHASEEIIAEALKRGATAYLLKNSASVELELAMDALRRGELYLSSWVALRMVQWFVRPLTPAQAPSAGIDCLTARQVEILSMIAQGKSTKQIAFALNLSDKTVAAHRAQIMGRLGIHDRAELLAFAEAHGLTSPIPPGHLRSRPAPPPSDSRRLRDSADPADAAKQTQQLSLSADFALLDQPF